MVIKSIKLPARNSDDFYANLIEFGHFLEKTVRPHCLYDLKIYPNPVWQEIQNKMLTELYNFSALQVGPDEIFMLQWYNSGVFIKTSEKILGFDILPIPRYYDWPEPTGLTTFIAKMVDMLFISHDHQDHYDKMLIEECINHGKLVFRHSDSSSASATTEKTVIRAEHDQLHECYGFKIFSRHACHVWREDINDVYLVYYEVHCPNGFSFIFSGDADYTKDFNCSPTKIDLLFITWRNPNYLYEPGHPDQTGTTIDAVKIAIEQIRPTRIILEHYGELDHIYNGFEASYDLAVFLIESLTVDTDIYFWGDITKLRETQKKCA